MAEKKQFLGEMLLKAGLVSRQQLVECLQAQQDTGKRLGDILVERGFVTNQQLMLILENQFKVPYIDLTRQAVPKELTRYVPVALARRNMLVPVKLEHDILYVALEDPKNFPALDDVRTATRMKVQPLLANGAAITALIGTLYGSEFAERAIEDFKKETNFDELVSTIASDADADVAGAPIVRLINAMLEQAAHEGASDIHIEPLEREVRVRLRVNGQLSVALNIPKTAHSAVITRLKIMGNMNIAERRLPQDGRFDINVLGRSIDIRLSTLPTVNGEKAVLRLLDRNAFLKPREELGFTAENLKKFDALLRTPHGIILLTGPTGSGKSTTLYTMLSEINTVKDNIVTVEDPVEYTMEGLNQVQVNPKAGLDFAASLRSILRQDPNVIMIGEMRDAETVQIAIRSAITGHLVLSTLHTNDATSTIFRLVDMGIPSYMVAASLVGVIAQRLVKTICPACKAPYTPTANELQMADLGDTADAIQFYKGAGCPSCNGTGYRGRIAVHEVLLIDHVMRDMIHRGESLDLLRITAIRNGMLSLKTATVELLRQGISTIDELIAIAHGQD